VKERPLERVIRRYANRKLYDASDRRHVTLLDLARMIAGGEDVLVLDQKTGEDITTIVMAQVVLEGIKQRTAIVPRQVLARLIRFASPSSKVSEAVAPQEAAGRARAEAERIVGGLLARGRLTLEEGLSLRQEVAQTVHRVVREAQRGLEDRLRSLLGGGKELGSLKELRGRLLDFETYFAAPQALTKTKKASSRRRHVEKKKHAEV